jgi:hypothetical protein
MRNAQPDMIWPEVGDQRPRDEMVMTPSAPPRRTDREVEDACDHAKAVEKGRG